MKQKKKCASRHQLPLKLPVRFGLPDGSNAHLLVDARGVVFGNLFGIMHHMSIEEAKAAPRCARGMRTAEYLVHAMNAHDIQAKALKVIAATAASKRIAKVAREALVNAGELED